MMLRTSASVSARTRITPPTRGFRRPEHKKRPCAYPRSRNAPCVSNHASTCSKGTRYVNIHDIHALPCSALKNPRTRYMVGASHLDTTYWTEQRGGHTHPQAATPLPPFGSAIAAVRASTALPQASYWHTPAPLKIITDLESALRALRRGDNPWFPKAFGSNCPAGSRRYRDTDLARMNAPSI